MQSIACFPFNEVIKDKKFPIRSLSLSSRDHPGGLGHMDEP